MTDELNGALAEPEMTKPEKTSPIGADVVTDDVVNAVGNSVPGKVMSESPPDWLKPMEEDEDDGGDGVKSSEWIIMKTNDDVPKVKRGRGRPRKGSHPVRSKTEPIIPPLLGRTRSSNASGTAIPVPDPAHTPEALPRKPQSINHNPISTSEKPRLIPISPAGGSSLSTTPNTEFHSPPRLTRVTPLSIDTSVTQNFVHTPAVKLGNVSRQSVSFTEPGKDGTELPIQLWLCPPMEPISPTKTQDMFSDQIVSSANFPGTTLNGSVTLKESLPLLSECESCGSAFPAQKIGDVMCYGCRPKYKKQSPPNIVFRKVGQDQWEVGKTTKKTKKHPRKQVLKQRPEHKKTVKMDIVPDGDDDDDDDDDDDEVVKKRSRRMCQQCDACLREDDCGTCDFCVDKPKFGGSNKKKQKCRLRQCKLQSRLHGQKGNIVEGKRNPSLPRRRRDEKPKLKRRGRPSKKQKLRSNPWEDDDEVSYKDEDDKEDLRRYKMNGRRKGGKRKWKYSFKEEEEDVFIEAVIEEDGASNTEENPDILANQTSAMVSNEMHSNTSGLSAQGLYYNMSGVPTAPYVLGSVPLCNSNPAPMGQVTSSLPMADDGTQNGFLQIEMVRVGSPPSHYTEAAQDTEQHVSEPQQEPTPVITHIFSLVGGENDRDQGLMELFTSLGQTVLPAHWVGVMSKGPILQLLQCSKISSMADTVVQIEKGYFYQVSVQNQPLLLMHAVYSRHPTCLESVDDVVSLLLDLEGLGVCQGYQNFHMGSQREPRMSVRAALCDLLIPKDEEQCPKCTHAVES
ncbi:uncharacterized protein LOC113074163 isoform X2 [Carassius auratus]|uniref:Uncharacterized protein LOC113074163 isoform X2 n=1 Tax=Carassius auratus TaxID=7957 RepID=A0A6P6N192_CARAU|nr:uncharacterized protein LOC113074163 isoform X2 [Carassius auratus]